MLTVHWQSIFSCVQPGYEKKNNKNVDVKKGMFVS